MNENFLTLFQLNKLIQETIKASLCETFWVKAEIAQVKENYSGHCYLELVEKDPSSDRILAQSKATIWSNTYRILKPYFETSTGRKLTEGIKILICVKVEYHEIYGLSLNISDIDPSYTIGDLALKKAEIIKRLKEEGVFDINHEQPLPLVPQRIAVISSETAAGYSDFVIHLTDNPFQYTFFIKLFPAYMQGEKAEESLIAALEFINQEIDKYDVVAIIRGGGSQVDLSCFDSYWLSLHVAQYPIPIITGIGHEQDDSIVDMVAHKRLKTPTAVADFLIECLNNFENQLDDLQIHAVELTQKVIADYKAILENAIYSMPIVIQERIHKESALISKSAYLTSKTIEKKMHDQLFLYTMSMHKASGALKHLFFRHKIQLKQHISSLKSLIPTKIENHESWLDQYRNIAQLVNPETILKKGFSITLLNDTPIKDSSKLSIKDSIKTILYKGSVVSEVKSTKKTNNP